VVAGVKPPHQLDREIVGAGREFAECCLARFRGGNCGEVFGLLGAFDQRLVLGAGQRYGLDIIAHR
jgi:hypothetical protein